MGRRKRFARWYLLFRKEGKTRVHIFEPLNSYELRKRLQKSWGMEP